MYGNEKIENIEGEYISKLRLIPFSSLGTPNGMLIGTKVDKIKIEFEEEEIEATNVIVGIYNKSLTKNGLYNALIGLDLLKK